jgi:hypothetical protein
MTYISKEVGENSYQKLISDKKRPSQSKPGLCSHSQSEGLVQAV